jgi:uncharacterized protein with von Willebrand factor type A (vWA) domain
MHQLGFSILELLEIVRVCGSLQVEKCPAWYLGDFLATGLVVRDPELADAVRRLDEDELELLAEQIHGLRASLATHRSLRLQTAERASG